MLPIAIVGVVAVVAILAWRGSASEKKRVAERLRRAETQPKPKPVQRRDRNAPQTLEKDPKTGVYKARED